MKIAVAHHSLNIPGGAERLCLVVIEALQKRGHDVSLITVEKTDWNLIQKNFGVVVKPNKEEYITKSRVSKNLSSIPIASTYFLTYIMQLLANKSKQKHDLIVNTFGDVINSIADLTYVHFPIRAALELSQIPAFSNKSMWWAIAPLYDLAVSLLDKVSPGALLTNSKFMQEIIKNFLHRDSLVIYPPVNVETLSSPSFRNRKEGCTVAIVASYTPKRYLEQVPLIAKYTKFAKFVIMGKADEYSVPTLRKLKEQISAFHVKDRITILTNVPIDKFLEILLRAKVYLHIMPYDHFGISVVEGMASGCVPVVHHSGGPWLDILDGRQGEYGFSYATAREAASYIDTLITDENLRNKVASRAFHRAKKFDRAVFMEKMVDVVERVAS
ncbi:MAG: glycosyltransferase [Candidatus Bathyarchaeota archaeon]|nr:glycosyltransferase [Candidatus Bathyarchaeota archaeon]